MQKSPNSVPGIRWLAAVLLIIYGFAKLNGSQFTVLDSELGKPLGEVSGFWLTWYYFGYSQIYGTRLALLQIGGAILLIYPRTSLIGALLLVPMMVNIILIDIFYGVEPSATFTALVIIVCLLVVLSRHARRLWEAVVVHAPSTTRRSIVRTLLLALILTASCTFTWWVANYNNRSPTRIDGVWSVEASSESPGAWSRVFFERNRAFMVVFRTADGRDSVHHFEIDNNGSIEVWQEWLTKGALLMQGQLQPDGRIHLSDSNNTGGSIWLRRISETAKPH